MGDIARLSQNERASRPEADLFPMFVDFSEASVAYATIVAKKGDIQHLLKSGRITRRLEDFRSLFSGPEPTLD
jgi:hypothetical protein